MTTRNVVLTERHETLIEALVQSGRYQNASEVMREGLRLVETHEVHEASKLAALRTAALAGTAALERGDYKEFADTDALLANLTAFANEVLSEAEGN